MKAAPGLQNMAGDRKNGTQGRGLFKLRLCSALLLPLCLLLVLLTPLKIVAADSVVKNGDFSISSPSDPNFGWTPSGAAIIDAGKLKLSEGGENYPEASQVILIPAGTSTLSFPLTMIALQPNQPASPPDALAFYLENPATGASLITPIDDTTNAIFNFQQTGEVSYSSKVTVPGASASGSIWTPALPVQVKIDIGDITGTDLPAKAVFMMINSAAGDASASQVEIDNFQTLAAPVANDDVLTVNEDTATLIDILANDIDINGNETLDPATVTVVSAPAHGALAAQADGKILYTPVANYWGPDSFTYTVKDKDGNLSNTATVSVTVAAMNDDFTDADETVGTNEDTTLTGSVFTGTTSVDGPVTVKSFTVAGDTAAYTAGATATIVGKGALTIGVTSVNDPPAASAGPDQSIREVTIVTLDGSASTDVDDANLAYSWTQISGTPTVALSDPAVAKPTFAAPLVQAAGGLLTFQLKVTDSGNVDSTDTVSIKINNYVIPCDVNDNGVVDLADSVLLLKTMSRLSTADVGMTLAADVNGDGRLDAAELICTFQHAAGLRVVP